MRRTVSEKLKRIGDLFPQERLEKSKRRWAWLWGQEQSVDRMPYVYHPMLFNPYDDTSAFGERLDKSLDEIIMRGFTDDDCIPSLFCGCRQSTIPNLFGAEEIVVENDVTCKRILQSIEDIDKLPEPSIYPGSVAENFLRMQEYFLEETQGELPVHVVDMQGPFDAAGQIIGYELLFASAYEDESRYRTLMKKFVDAFILFWDAQREVCGKNFVGTHLYSWDWLPEMNCATMSVDSLAMVSPAFYDNYYADILQQLGKRFSSLIVHSCGNFSHVVKNLVKTDIIRGINASQMSLKQLAESGVPENMVEIVVSDFDGLDELARASDKYGARFDVSVTGLYERALGFPIKPVSEWSAQQIAELKRLDEAVKKKLSTLRIVSGTGE